MYRDPYRRYRRQTRRSWRGRRDPFPVMFYDPGEPLGLIMAAALARWAYRHRSAFWPFAIMAGAFLAAGLAHPQHARIWVLTALGTVLVTFLAAIPHRLRWASPAARVTAGLITRMWEACGIARPAERAYAAAVFAVTGGWLSAAIAIGPSVKPLPGIAAISTVILGIPWWAHRRRRARVRAERTLSAWPELAENMGLPGSKIASLVVDAWGWTARVILRKGTTAAQAINQLPAIESGLGLRPGSARAIPDLARADRFTLRVIERDPHAQPVPWRTPSSATITAPISLGLFEDGRPARVLILRRNVLIGGTTGAGKSGIVNVILAALAACADVVIWGVDLKGGMELGPWAECLGRPLATTPAQAIQLFADAIAELDRRAADLAARGRRVWDPAPDMPALVIVVDEYAELPPQAREYADSLARRGRAVAVNLLAATQRPTQEAMGHNAVRSQMDVRICLRVKERRDVDLILGQGSFTSGWHAHSLALPGTFLISDPEHTAPERARAYLITDDQVTAQAARHPSQDPGTPQEAPRSPQDAPGGEPVADGWSGPDVALWAALRRAGPDGVPVADLLALTGMSRPTLYRRLREHAQAGRVVQTVRGSWRAVERPDGPGDGRPPARPRSPRRPPRGPRPPRRRPRSGDDG
jgi:DNA segregation ATPase FtsK/SpoIIIE, S-DNA-T family